MCILRSLRGHIGPAGVLLAVAWSLPLPAGTARAQTTRSAATSRPEAPRTAPASASTRPAATTAAAVRAGARLPLRTEHPRPLPTLPDTGTGGLLGRLAAYVVVILLLGGAAIVLGRRFLPRFQPAGSGKVRVVDSTYLAPRKQLHVVEVGSQRFLLASSRDSVTMVAELKGAFSGIIEQQQARLEAGGPAGQDAAAGAAGEGAV